jgi:Fe-S cluster biogenesis protein NfuA
MSYKVEDIKEELDKMRRYLQADGGDLTFIRYDAQTNDVFVELQGACAGCPGAQMTLKMGVERELRKRFPEIVIKAI